jgi:16S rRNA (guanine527-N7)-methyltransferase
MDTDQDIATFSSFYSVSRETIISLKKYEDMLIKSNKKLNLVGKSTINQIWHRHFLDSFQVIDFIDKNDNFLSDLGSGAGLPGIVLAIAAKERKMSIKINLIEKSPKKTIFLEDAVKKLKLSNNVRVFCKDILKSEKKILEDVFVARAFKPLPIILELINNKCDNFKKIIIFLGKTGFKALEEASKSWHIEYNQRRSVTSDDSTIIEVFKLKKIN